MSKYCTYIVPVLISLSYNTSHSMLNKWQYKPIIQVQNAEFIAMREKIKLLLCARKINDIVTINPNITIIRKARAEERGLEYKCFQYAIAQTTGFKENVDFYLGKKDLTSISIENYFQQTNYPQKGDLVIYTTSETDLTMLHFGIFIDNVTVESKWGNFLEIFHHPLFDIASNYGAAAGFFTLKHEYKADQQKLHADMRQEINLKQERKLDQMCQVDSQVQEMLRALHSPF